MTIEGCSLPHEGRDGYCPECGLLREGTVREQPCHCGVRNVTGSVFCENCGRRLASAERVPDAAAPPVPDPRRTWFAVVSADPKLFAAVDAEARGFAFPEIAERWVALQEEARIGRSDGSGPRPEIDLNGPPPDPGVSREHAELSRHGDGGWRLRDCGSHNGTYVGVRRLDRDEVVSLSGGEKIRLGLWSRIVLVRGGD